MKNYSYLYVLIQQSPCFRCALLYRPGALLYDLIHLWAVPCAVAIATAYPPVGTPGALSHEGNSTRNKPLVAGVFAKSGPKVRPVHRSLFGRSPAGVHLRAK